MHIFFCAGRGGADIQKSKRLCQVFLHPLSGRLLLLQIQHDFLRVSPGRVRNHRATEGESNGVGGNDGKGRLERLIGNEATR